MLRVGLHEIGQLRFLLAGEVPFIACDNEIHDRMLIHTADGGQCSLEPVLRPLIQLRCLIADRWKLIKARIEARVREQKGR